MRAGGRGGEVSGGGRVGGIADHKLTSVKQWHSTTPAGSKVNPRFTEKKEEEEKRREEIKKAHWAPLGHEPLSETIDMSSLQSPSREYMV